MYFWQAELWEVGVYVLIQHHDGEMCATLKTQMRLKESVQTDRDAKDASPNDLPDSGEVFGNSRIQREDHARGISEKGEEDETIDGFGDVEFEEYMN